jgi:hypothetical protein
VPHERLKYEQGACIKMLSRADFPAIQVFNGHLKGSAMRVVGGELLLT